MLNELRVQKEFFVPACAVIVYYSVANAIRKIQVSSWSTVSIIGVLNEIPILIISLMVFDDNVFSTELRIARGTIPSRAKVCVSESRTSPQ